jgi:hypothetical protein
MVSLCVCAIHTIHITMSVCVRVCTHAYICVCKGMLRTESLFTASSSLTFPYILYKIMSYMLEYIMEITSISARSVLTPSEQISKYSWTFLSSKC